VNSCKFGKVSVIIPVYKTEKYVEAAVASVLNQTYQNLEIIVVDDGSPDDSLKLVRQFDDPRIRIIEQENRGLAGARNTGIRHAVGEYIAFLDSDDVWLPEKLAKHVKHLETCPSGRGEF
jgi:glycosyltransferase involved in cell wall biosynthesis